MAKAIKITDFSLLQAGMSSKLTKSNTVTLNRPYYNTLRNTFSATSFALGKYKIIVNNQ